MGRRATTPVWYSCTQFRERQPARTSTVHWIAPFMMPVHCVGCCAVSPFTLSSVSLTRSPHCAMRDPSAIELMNT